MIDPTIRLSDIIVGVGIAFAIGSNALRVPKIEDKLEKLSDNLIKFTQVVARLEGQFESFTRGQYGRSE